MKRYKILALDPGLGTTGWANIQFTPKDGEMTVSDVGNFKCTSESKKVAYKENANKFGSRVVALDILEQNLQQVYDKIQPNYVVVEDIFINKNNPKMISAYMALGQWMTVVQMFMYRNRKRVYKIPTKSAKHCVANHGGAGKESIQSAVFSLNNLKFKKKIKTLVEHEADAIAIGYTFGQLALPDLLNKE